MTDDPRGRFLIALARALHESGVPAHRLEDTVDLAANALGVPVNCLSQPTSLILDLGDGAHVLRVHPREVHLERMVLIDAIGGEVARGRLFPSDALQQLDAVMRRPERWPGWLALVAGGVSSASAAVFFHAPWAAVAVAGALGLLAALLGNLARSWRPYGRVHELAASFLVAAIATLLGRALPVSATLVTLAGIIGLLPGLSLTVALTELATRHLASGTARLMGAVVSFVQLGIGTALGWRLAALLPKAIRPIGDAPPEAALWAAVPVAAGAFVVSLRARPRDYFWIVGVSLLGFGAAQAGQTWLGPELGAFVGGLVVGLASNVQARVRRVATAVTQVPGLLLLVPGSVGFRGFGAMLDDDVSAGVSAGFATVVIAASLVAGILAAGILLPPRRSL